jgi:hypothetical protein
MRKLFAVLVASAISTTSLAAQNVAGTWDASYNTPGGPRSFKVILVQDGEKLKGTVKREQGESSLAGTAKNDSVKFVYQIDYNGNKLEMTVAAKVTADAMKGIVDFAGQAQEPFEAKKTAGPEKKTP